MGVSFSMSSVAVHQSVGVGSASVGNGNNVPCPYVHLNGIDNFIDGSEY